MEMKKNSPVIQLILFALTFIGLIGSGYNHLAFIMESVENFGLDDILDAWPLFFVAISALLLGTSVLITPVNRGKAAQIAFIATLFGWLYYLITGCTLFLYISVMFFALPQSFIFFVIPCLLLIGTTIYSWRVSTSRKKEYRITSPEMKNEPPG